MNSFQVDECVKPFLCETTNEIDGSEMKYNCEDRTMSECVIAPGGGKCNPDRGCDEENSGVALTAALISALAIASAL